MSSHNPLRPKSSLLEQKAKSRSGLQMVMIIVAVHVVFLGGLLFSGCREDQQPATDTVAGTNAIQVLPPTGGGVASPPAETNTVTVVEAPAAPPLPPRGPPTVPSSVRSRRPYQAPPPGSPVLLSPPSPPNAPPPPPFESVLLFVLRPLPMPPTVV